MTFTYEIGYLKECVSELEAYLLSDELFWPISVSPPEGSKPYPRLTLGGILLSDRYAEAFAELPSESSELEMIRSQIDHYRNKWLLKWDEKAHRGLTSRLNQWKNFIQEYRQNPEGQAGFFAYEVRWLVMADLLRDEVREIAEAEEDMWRGLILILQPLFNSDEFIWGARLKRVFPEDRFWYLYGRLKEKVI